MHDRKRNLTATTTTTTTTTAAVANNEDNAIWFSSDSNPTTIGHNKRFRRSISSFNSSSTNSSTMNEELQCSWCEEFKSIQEFRHSSPTSSSDISICAYCSFHRIAI
mmetsp:Transcript_7227/g.10210  ORF Transcript_7227/g.10210 Transcript_7227/m.10210 type:complete len:107 (+) Transcript_7227:218-538(+)